MKSSQKSKKTNVLGIVVVFLLASLLSCKPKEECFIIIANESDETLECIIKSLATSDSESIEFIALPHKHKTKTMPVGDVRISIVSRNSDFDYTWEWENISETEYTFTFWQRSSGLGYSIDY
jgi:hypothetical protein